MIPPGKRHSVRLCATFVKTVSVPGRYGYGYGGLGLSLRVTPRKSGGLSKTWAQAISANGTKTSLGLGSYPVVTLAMARERALENARATAGFAPPVRGGAMQSTAPRGPRHARPAASSSSAWTKSTKCSDGSKAASEDADGWPAGRFGRLSPPVSRRAPRTGDRGVAAMRADPHRTHRTMAISDKLSAQILRYHVVENWRVDTIASQRCLIRAGP